MSKVIKLLADWDSGEGEIRLPPEWQSEYPLMKLDLLKDWIFLLETEYKRELKKWSEELKVRKVAAFK